MAYVPQHAAYSGHHDHASVERSFALVGKINQLVDVGFQLVDLGGHLVKPALVVLHLLPQDAILDGIDFGRVHYSYRMFMEPASKVSVPPTVVMRTRSNVPERVTDPATIEVDDALVYVDP